MGKVELVMTKPGKTFKDYVEDTNENYRIIEPITAERYQEWKTRNKHFVKNERRRNDGRGDSIMDTQTNLSKPFVLGR